MLQLSSLSLVFINAPNASSVMTVTFAKYLMTCPRPLSPLIRPQPTLLVQVLDTGHRSSISPSPEESPLSCQRNFAKVYTAPILGPSHC